MKRQARPGRNSITFSVRSTKAAARTWLDLSGLNAVEPAFFEVLLRHVTRFRARGGDVVLACPAEPAPAAELRTEHRIDDAVASLLA
jgi:anti-anti-sigma regulatory factor